MHRAFKITPRGPSLARQCNYTSMSAASVFRFKIWLRLQGSVKESGDWQWGRRHRQKRERQREKSMRENQNRFWLQPLTVDLFNEGEREKRRVKERNADSPGSEQKPTIVFIMVEAGRSTKSEERWGLCVRTCAPCVFMCVSREECYGWPGRHCVGWHGGQSGRQSWRTHLVSEGCFCLNLLLNHSEDAGLWFFLSLPLSSFPSMPIDHTLQRSFLCLFWPSLVSLTLPHPLPLCLWYYIVL